MLFATILSTLLSVASAQIQMDQNQMNAKNSLRILKVTGEDAVTLRKLVSDYEMQPDDVLSMGIEKADNSSIRSIECGTDSCTIQFIGDVSTNKDAQEYYSQEFNEKLLSLKDNQVLITNYPSEVTGSTRQYESRILRLMQENRNEISNIEEKISTPVTVKHPDNTGSLLYQFKLKFNSMRLACYSSIMTGMGNRNFLSEVCSFEAVVDLK